VTAPVDSLPDLALAPDHAPEAVQEVAFVADQVSIEDPPPGTDVGFAAITTATPPAAVGPAASCCSTAPQAANARATRGKSPNVFIRNMGIPPSANDTPIADLLLVLVTDDSINFIAHRRSGSAR
jgi:hypothetical protein